MTRHSRIFMLLVLFMTVGLLFPSDALAQRARPRSGSPPSGKAVPRVSPPRVHRPYYYYPRYFYPGYYYSPWYYSGWYYPYYSGFGFGLSFGYGPWGPYPYGYRYQYPYAYPYWWYDNTGSARLQITPRHAQVYIDGHFVGLVDEFDGTFQRLHVEIGEHELQVYLEGYRTFTQKVLFTRGTTLRIEHALEPLPPGEPPEPKPTPDPAAAQPQYPQAPGPVPRYPGRVGEESEFGTLSIRVNPPDAEVLVDGQPWDRPEGDVRFSIDLPEGPHRVEVRKEGYRPYVRTVDVRRGRTITLNVSLIGQVSTGPTPSRLPVRRG
ncbi:MAG TPA: PEGA domain-containing protein [Vicinamibacterales bacterium]|nr:PEGA domain-containing protein [Vicinamibacterales bacterium]